MAAEYQIPGGAYVNETNSNQAQVPGWQFVDQTQAAATVKTWAQAFGGD